MGRKGKELSKEIKDVAWKLLQEGKSITYVSETLGVNRSTIGSFKKRVERRGSTENIPRRGRTPSVTARDYRKLERLVKTNRRESLQDITDRFNENRQQPISKRTVQLHQHKNGFVRRVAKKKVVIREVNRKKRLSWCREKRKLSVDNYWKKIIFSDESKIVVGQDSRIYIWRKRGEGWRPDLVEARRAKPCFAVMIWGCITWHGVGTITAVEGNINAQKYQQILDDNLCPVIAQHFPNDQYIFQDDNAPVHRARSTQEFIHRNGPHKVLTLTLLKIFGCTSKESFRDALVG